MEWDLSMPGSRAQDVTVQTSRVLHEGRVFRLLHERVRLPSGRVQELDVVEHRGAVAVVARERDGRLVLVRQYRHAVGEWTVELPAGRLEPDEDPLECAHRELEEETGLVAGRWTFLRTFVPSPGFCSERIHLFLAEDLAPVVGEPRPHDPDEEIDVVRLWPRDLVAGATSDAKTLVALVCLEPGLSAQGPDSSVKVERT